MDQTLSSMHVLSKCLSQNEALRRNADIILMDVDSLVQYLHPGSHHITISTVLESNKGVGLIPLNGKWETIKTSGLKWNLGNSSEEFSSLEFGGEMISTSNEIKRDEVEIENSHPLMWITTTTQYFIEWCALI